MTSRCPVAEVYERLHRRYGPQHWWPGDSPLEVILGAILTQAAAWGNVEQALANLKGAHLLSLAALQKVPLEALAALVRPAGYFNAKARKIKAFVQHLTVHHQGDLRAFLVQPAERLREELLGIYGIGPETADAILLYAAGYPFFVVDAYTRRIFHRLGITPSNDSYQGWQDHFHRALPRSAPLYNEYHALLVAHGKATCRNVPQCRLCPILDLCPTGRVQTEGPPASHS